VSTAHFICVTYVNFCQEVSYGIPVIGIVVDSTVSPCHICSVLFQVGI
jgi:hypothetical protein